jgi:hypothetical protein
MVMQSATKAVLALLGAALAPMILLSILLYISRLHPNLISATATGDFVDLSVALVPGSICMFYLARALGWWSSRLVSNVMIIVLYIMASGLLLLFYGLGFLCVFFGECQ